MHDVERAAIFGQLEMMPRHLSEVARELGADRIRRRPAAGGFSVVEHAWHLADIEDEGYGLRIRRIVTESGPLLADFDGDRLAAERHYQERPLDAALAAFAYARARNLTALRQIAVADWSRLARQEGIGALTLADLPRMMAGHDAAHRAEIDALRVEGALEALVGSPSRLRTLLGRFSQDALRRMPSAPPVGAEALSPIGHACHLRDFDAEAYRVRIRRMRTEIDPRLASVSGEELARERAYDSADPEQTLSAFEQARSETLGVLRGVAPGEWSRSGDFEGHGRVTLLRLVEILAEHDQLHLAALESMPRD